MIDLSRLWFLLRIRPIPLAAPKQRTHARAPNSVLDQTKKSRCCLAGGATPTANYSRPNEAQHAR